MSELRQGLKSAAPQANLDGIERHRDKVKGLEMPSSEQNQLRHSGSAGLPAATGASVGAVRGELEKILRSRGFANAERLSRFLRFTVETTLQGRADQLKESVLGVEVFERKPTYDPRIDAVVRVEAVKLRARLQEYYETEGRGDLLTIELPKGRYVPVFHKRERTLGKGIHRGTWIVFLVTALLVMGFAVYRAVDRPGIATRTSGGGQPTIAVLPFVNLSPDKDNEYLSDGLTEELIDALGKIEGLHVVARTSTYQFKGKAYDIREIGKQLNVGAVLEGGVRKETDKLRVTARLIRVANGYRLWSETYDRKLKDVFVIQEEIARAVVGALQVQLRQSPATSLATQYTHDIAIYTLYLKGRYFGDSQTPQDLAKSTGYYEEVIAKDPKYAPAYAALSGAYFKMNRRWVGAPKDLCPKAKSAAMKALNLDSTLGAAHATLAEIKLFFDHDWPGAEREFEQALRLEPNNGDIHNRYSQFFLVQCRFEESLAEIKRYFELTPASPHLDVRLGAYYFYSHQWDEAIRVLSRALETDPNVALARNMVGVAYLKKGRYNEAIEQLEEGVRVDVTGGGQASIMCLGYAYGVMGRKDEATKCLNKLKELSKHMYVTAYSLAPIYAGLGRRAEALDSLEKAYEEHAPNVVMTRLDPYFDSIDSEPRFQALLKKVGPRGR